MGEIVKNSGKNRGKILGEIMEKIQALEINKENLKLLKTNK